MGLKIVTPATVEPITVAQARDHLLLPVINGAHPADNLINDVYIPGARARVQDITQRPLAPTGYELTLDVFPTGAIDLLPPLNVTSVTYTDTAGDSQTLDSAEYRVDGDRMLVPVDSWPAGKDITIAFDAGYASADLPPALRNAMLLLITHYFVNRQAVAEKPSHELAEGVTALCLPYILDYGV